MSNEQRLDEVRKFANTVKAKNWRAPIGDVNPYRGSMGRYVSSVSRDGFDKEDIRRILESGDADQLRELSKYFYRFRGTYSRPIQYYATLLDYSYIVLPHYNVAAKPKKLKQQYAETCEYIRNLHLDKVLPQINNIILTEGVYYGLLIESEDRKKASFYRLPAKYCRTRFLDENAIPVLELNLSYFDTVVSNDVERINVLKLFPEFVQKAYKKKKVDWIEIPISAGGIAFFFNEDKTPPFASSALSQKDLEGAREREVERDRKELEKLLIHKLPVNKNDGTLLFSLPEAEELHASICEMLSDNDTIDVITTYGEITLENAQDSEGAATASASRMEKYVSNAYDDLGVSQYIFNSSDTATALTFSIKKDVNQMFVWSKCYEIAINYLLRSRAKSASTYFEIRFLPNSSIFRKDNVDLYLKTAQYGFPRSALAATLGFDTNELIQICDFETQVLDLNSVMTPLQSSYTTSGTEKNSSSEKNSGAITPQKDITDEGGRPQSDDKSDKTLENLDNAT